MYLHQIKIAGMVGQPPVIRTVKNNMQLATFSVAILERRGVYPNITRETIWYKIVVFGNDALAVTSDIGKGDNVLIEGKPQLNTYVDKEGVNKAEITITANKVYKVQDIRYREPKPVQAAPQPAPAPPQPLPASNYVEPQITLPDDDLDTLPF